jgi:spore maturation protein CgeB
MKIVIFGLTLSSSWGNRHADFWRGFSRALAQRGHRLSFYERDLSVFANHRDLAAWENGQLWLFSTWDKIRYRARRDLADADVAIVTSGCPDAAAATALIQEASGPMPVFHDLDSAATLDFEESELPVVYTPPESLSAFDLVLSCTGGNALDELRTLLGARRVATLYPAVDPDGKDYPAATQLSRRPSGLSVLADRNDEDEAAFERLFVEPSRRLSKRHFRIGGLALQPVREVGANVSYEQVVNARDRSAFLRNSRLLLSIAGRSNQRLGFCPSELLFQAAASGTPVLSDRWEGLNLFLEPGSEILVADNSADAVAAIELTDAELAAIAANAYQRILDEHTFPHRAIHLETLIENTMNAADEEQLLRAREAGVMEDVAG